VAVNFIDWWSIRRKPPTFPGTSHWQTLSPWHKYVVVCLCCNILFDEHRTATVVRVVVDRPLQGTISSKYFYEEKYIHLYYYNIYIYKQTISNWYIMKRKFKHWWSLIPPMSTKRTITAYPHWTLLHTKKTTSYMTLKIQVPLVWDGHKKWRSYTG
jgi:hypothetical protein